MEGNDWIWFGFLAFMGIFIFSLIMIGWSTNKEIKSMKENALSLGPVRCLKCNHLGVLTVNSESVGGFGNFDTKNTLVCSKCRSPDWKKE